MPSQCGTVDYGTFLIDIPAIILQVLYITFLLLRIRGRHRAQMVLPVHTRLLHIAALAAFTWVLSHVFNTWCDIAHGDMGPLFTECWRVVYACAHTCTVVAIDGVAVWIAQAGAGKAALERTYLLLFLWGALYMSFSMLKPDPDADPVTCTSHFSWRSECPRMALDITAAALAVAAVLFAYARSFCHCCDKHPHDLGP